MKNVLVVGLSANAGGVESVIMNYFRKLNNNGNLHFDFLCNVPKTAYEDEIINSGSKVFHIPSRHLDPIGFYRAVYDFFSKNGDKYSTIWVNACSLANIVYLKQAKRVGIPKRIIHCHNSQNCEGFIGGILHDLNRSRISRYVTDCWSCANNASEWFYGKHYQNLPRYKVIPNAIEVKRYEFNFNKRTEMRNELGLHDNIVIGNVGRFHPQKNHVFMISLFKELYDLDSRYRLLLVGDGELRTQICDLIKENNLEGSVILSGSVPNVPDYYQVMDIFLFPSLYEGLPVAPLEAQANGLPCIFSKSIPKESIINSNVCVIDDSISSNLVKNIDNWIKKQKRDSSNLIKSSIFNIEKQVQFIGAYF